MTKVAVFDSGFGSLSIIKPIQKRTKTDIIYFADQKNFPYGTKSTGELKKIIKSSIAVLEKKFNPDLIVIGSNTPSLLLRHILEKSKIIGVFPPLKDAANRTRSNSIAILVTKSVIESFALKNYIKKNLSEKIRVTKINASPLVELVESGKFVHNRKFCEKRIRRVLSPLLQNNVDVAILSSTHLPFLLPMLKKIFPHIVFLDPGDVVANQVAQILNRRQAKINKIKIFTSGNVNNFQKQLRKIGIKNKVMQL